MSLNLISKSNRIVYSINRYRNTILVEYIELRMHQEHTAGNILPNEEMLEISN